MKIEKRYLDEDDWTEIRFDLAVFCPTEYFSAPEAVLAEAEANERAAPGSGLIRTPFALYRVVVKE